MENMEMKDMLLEDLEKVAGGTLPDTPEWHAYVNYRNSLLKKYNCPGSMLQKIATPEEWAKFQELFEAYRATRVKD